MSKKSDTGAAKLDLGLEALLARSESGACDGSPSDSKAKDQTSIITLDENSGSFSEEFTSLAQARQWGILVGKTETALATEGDIEARLWWIRAHLGAFSLPVSLLAAPFETLCRQLTRDSTATAVFRPLVAEIGDIMVERLRGVGDRRQEVSVRTVLNNLGLGGDEKNRGVKGNGAQPAAVRFELGSPGQEMVTAGEGASPANNKRRFSLWIAVFVICLLALVVGVGRVLFTEPCVTAASEGLLSDQSAPTLVSPVVEARAVHGDLGALYYSLEDGGLPAPAADARPAVPAPQQAPAQQSAGRANSQGAKSQVPPEKVPAEEKPIKGGKDLVNTVGPAEGSEFRRGVEGGRYGEQARLPNRGYELRPNPVPNTGMPEIGGSLLGEIKAVIVDTNVVDHPSYEARIIAKLREGDKVSVEARAGRWVRIRSRQGKTGYVFAQDIGELEDFRLPDGSSR